MDVGIGRMFKFIKNNDSVTDICERLELKPSELFGVIEILRSKGYNIDTYEKDGELFICKKSSHKKAIQVKKDIDEFEKISLGVLSDTHCGSKLEQPSLVKRFYEEGKERNVDEFLHMGDMNDGHYSPKRPAHIYDLHALGFTEQAKNVVNNYPCVRRENGEIIPTYFIGGSHDMTHILNGGADIGDYIDERREDMHFLGYNQAIHNVGKNKNVAIKMQHPGGGVAKAHSYKSQEGINKIESGEKPKLLLQGHYHKSYYMFYRNIHTFLVPCMCAQSEFMKMNDIINTVGGYFIDLYVNNKGEIQYISFDEVLYGKDDINPDDYLSLKRTIKNK